MRGKQTVRLAALGAVGMLLSATPFITTASAEEDGRLYYKEGTRLEFDDADLKLNVMLQPRYTYEDRSQEDRQAAGFEGGEDSSSFKMRTARLILSGNVLDKQFSYKLMNDFSSDNGKSEMKDAWIQWNGEMLNARFGQFKVPFGRQERASLSALYFVNRSEANEEFKYAWDTGAQLDTTLGEVVNIATGLFNGNSVGEGIGRPGVDPRVNWGTSVDFTTVEYGSRGVEGDLREDGDVGVTVGGSMVIGDGVNTIDAEVAPESNFNQTALGADAGVRFCGFDLQGEYFWREVDFDALSDKVETDGFYLQASYTMDKLGFGYRYGYISLDEQQEDGIDTQQEHSVVFNYFLNGHSLKIQNGVTWEINEVTTGSDDINDFRYELQLAGLF